MKDFEQENIIDKWLEKNGTKEIEKQVENEYKEIMKLEDRFEDAILNDAGNVYKAVEQCVEISNAETIAFAEWKDNNYFHHFDTKNYSVLHDFSSNPKYTTTELLKIYQDLSK